MMNSKICHHYQIYLQDIINLMTVSLWSMEHTPSGGCNEYMVTLILMQLVLKLVRKLKASLWVQFFPNIPKFMHLLQQIQNRTILSLKLGFLDL